MRQLLIAVLLVIPLVGMAHGQTPPGQQPSPPFDVVEDLEDRVTGTYAFECNGYRVDGTSGQVLDWTFRKDQMNYLIYGATSHTVIKAVNEFYTRAGDTALKETGVQPEGIPVPGITIPEQ